MKKRLVSLGLCICFLAATGCAAKTAGAPTNMSAVETVNYYFEKYNEKDYRGLESVVAEATRGKELNLDSLNYIRLRSCKVEEDRGKIDYVTNCKVEKEPYDMALVYTTFEINYREDSQGHLPNGVYQWAYYLVKEHEKSDWRIVRW